MAWEEDGNRENECERTSVSLLSSTPPNRVRVDGASFVPRRRKRLGSDVLRIAIEFDAVATVGGSNAKTAVAKPPPSIREPWSHLRDLNPRPTVYETVALPLS